MDNWAAAAAERGASMLDMGEGFLALPRRLCASPFFRSLRADERYVVVQMLLVARYAEGGAFWFAGQRIDLVPGQFIEAEETLAELAGSTRKVVRGVYRKAEKAGLVSRKKAHASGQCPHITTILDYERIRYAGGEAGPRTGQERARERANSGPAEGPHQNPEDQANHVQPANPAGGLVGASLEDFRKKLGAALGLADPIDIGKDGQRVTEFFVAQIAEHGQETILADCIETARRSRSGTPTSLAFFPGWLRRLPGKKAKGHAMVPPGKVYAGTPWAPRGPQPVAAEHVLTLADVAALEGSPATADEIARIRGRAPRESVRTLAEVAAEQGCA